MVKNKNIALVVPTIREDSIKKFIQVWGNVGLFNYVDLIVMEDNPTKTFKFGCPVEWSDQESILIHLCWQDIDADLGPNSWIIPRRSDTVRSYAYYYAWKCGYRYIMTLDDDCYPDDSFPTMEHFVTGHLLALEGRTRWFNTLNDVKPRGIPFENLGSRHDVILNHGLWTNVLDYDAPTQLANPGKEDHSYDNVLIPRGSFFPMCGMNVCFDSRYAVWMYHLLMGHEKQDSLGLIKLPFDRFGDIWCGLFAKKLSDLYDLSISTGTPYIRHERASNPFTNLKKEANGLEVNEKLWEYIDGFVSEDERHGFLHCGKRNASKLYIELAEHIGLYDEFLEHKDYFKHLGEAMQIWANLFKEELR